ncbi:glycosyltransferase family 4 protein [Variovorax sp. M-6]|uniref:glycosyltransferase family 4 protein n=1 Tax=Variovorax sp. M-6 TaxID=3233041 RepID=UPI003F9A6C0C
MQQASATTPEFCTLLIVDEIVPADFSPFRTLEYSHYLSYFDSSRLVCTEGWHGWASNGSLQEVLANSGLPDQIKPKVVHRTALDRIVARLAYVTFLNNAWQVFPHLQERQIPFVLQLYPGGGFEANVAESDEKLKALCASELCRKIIVTQNLSRDYLIDKIGCAPSKIEFVYGGVYDTRNDFDFLRDKRRYPEHKPTIDICFVAHRYGDDTRKKGYDPFIAVAQALAPLHPHLRFHVVGDYTPDQLPLGSAEGRITFHGKQPNGFFADFYPTMDLILSVNRPTNDDSGAFDGFPTGACMEAGFRGVLNCISDPLGMNVAFEDNVDIVLLDFDVERTIQRIRELIEDPERLYRMAYANWKKFIEVFDTDRQLWARCRLITNELLAAEALVIRPAASLSAMDGGLTPLLNANKRLSADLHGLQRIRDALVMEVRGATEGLADTERRHDNLLLEYQKLDRGFVAHQAESARQLQAAQARHDALVDAHEHLARDLGLPAAAPMPRLEKHVITVLRSPFARKLRAGLSRVAKRVARKP